MSEITSYFPEFVSEPDTAFSRLWDELDWVRHDDAPRIEYWSNDFDAPYTYGRGAGERTYYAQPWHDIVLAVREKLHQEHDVYFEGCFLNGYLGERQSLGWHSDNSPYIDHSKPIAVVSFGQKRFIEYRANDDKLAHGVELASGSLFLMHAGMQQTHQHRIPKASFKCEPRISLTFRSLINPEEMTSA
jgi:alkylated DNA repair dioxygenase AlkB